LPQLADRADAFGSVLRRGAVDRRLFELMTLVVARHWSAQYEWHAHAPHAAEAGVAPEVVEAIRTNAVPPFARDDERLVYEVVTERMETRDLLPATYERAVGALDLEQTIELVTAIDFYTLFAIMLKASTPVPGGSQPLMACLL